MGEEYKIALGVDIDVDDIRTQIKNAESKVSPIKLNVEIENLNEIRQQLQNLGGTKGKAKLDIPINTQSIEQSFTRVANAVDDIKNSLGSLKSEAGMKNLLSSINQIATALGKAENESKNLINSLSVLANKDFSLNFNLKAGNSNPVKAMTDYGRAVRNEVIPQLESQVAHLQKLIGGSVEAERALGNLLTLRYKSRGAEKKSSLLGALGDESSLSKQMDAYRQYIGYLKQIASMKGKSLSGFDTLFPKSSDELINDVTKLQTGVKETEEQFNKLKQIFSSGVNAEGLGQALQPIIDDLAEIKNYLADLSSGESLKGLTASFNELSNTLNRLSENFILVQKNLNGGLSGAGSSVSSIAQDFKEVDIKIDATEDQLRNLQAALDKVGLNKTSINSITNEFQELGITVKNVTSRLNDDGSVTLTVKGLDQYKDAVTVMKSIGKDGLVVKGVTTISRDFKEVENSFNRLKSIGKEMGRLEIKIAGLDADKNANEIAELTSQLGRLQSEYNELYAITERSFSDEQINDLAQDFISVSDRLDVVKAKMADVAAYNQAQAEIKETESAFEELVAVAKKIESINLRIGKLDDKSNSNEIEYLTTQLKELEQTYAELRTKLQGKLSGDQLSSLTASAVEADNKLKQLDAQLADTKANLAKKIQIQLESGKFTTQVQKVRSDAKNLSQASDELRTNLAALDRAESAMNTAFKGNDVDRKIQAYKEYKATLELVENQLKQNKLAERDSVNEAALKQSRDKLSLDMNNWLKENSAAAKNFGGRIRELQTQIQNCDKTTLSRLRAEFTNIKKEAQLAGKTTQTFGDRIKAQFERYSTYFSVYTLFMYAARGLRSMFEQVKLIDSAMTELKKVTNETDEAYSNFLKNAATRSREIGTTIDGLVSSTADFARLGYGFEDAQGLAEVANIYAVVGDEINGVEGATESLISTMAAFKDEMNGMSNTDFAMSIIDKFNEIGNNFAISSGGIGEALERSASSLMAANNTIDESIALITAANTVVQDPEQVGKVMPTLKVAISVKLQRWTRPRKDFII